MEKTIILKNIAGNQMLKFTCVGTPDFAHRTTHVLVYFNDEPDPKYDKFAELHIAETNQRFTNIFELPVKQGAERAKVVISTNRAGHSLDVIDCIAM